MTVLSTLLKADGMGLAEKLSEWLLRRRERQEERNMRQVAAYFGSLLNKRRADAGAILQSVRDYRDCPEVTRKQAELLLEHRFFRYVYQTGYPEWRAVMDALKETRYGMREGAAIPRSVREAAESPMLRLAAQYKVLEYENTRRNAPQPLSPEAQAERVRTVFAGMTEVSELKQMAWKPCAASVSTSFCNLQIFLCLFLEKLNMPQNTPVTKAS